MASTRSPPNRGSTPLAQDEGEFVAALLAGLDAYLASTSSLDRSFVTCLDWLISGAYRSACSAGPPTMSPPHSALVRIGIGRPAEPAPASAARTAARGSASTLPANRGRPSLLSLGRCPQCCEEMRCNVRVTSPCARRNIASGPGMLWSTAGMHSIMLPFVVTATSRRNRAFAGRLHPNRHQASYRHDVPLLLARPPARIIVPFHHRSLCYAWAGIRNDTTVTPCGARPKAGQGLPISR